MTPPPGRHCPAAFGATSGLRRHLPGLKHRIGFFKKLHDHILGHEGVLTWTGGEILDWFRSELTRLGA